MPLLQGNIRPHLVHLLRNVQHPALHIHQAHALLHAQLAQRALQRHRHLRQANELGAFLVLARRRRAQRRAGVVEDKGARVLKGPRNGHVLQEQPLAVRIHLCANVAAVAVEPEGRADDKLCPVGGQRAARLREGQVPADDEADAAKGRVKGRVRRQRVGRQVRPLRVPQVLLLVAAQHGAVGADEVRGVGDALLGRFAIGGQRLQDRAGDDGDGELLGEGLVSRQVRRLLLGFGEEDRGVGLPRGEVVFGEDGQVCALGGGFADVGLCAGKVAGYVEGLIQPI